MSKTIRLQYGSIQPLLSGRMQKSPVLSKILNNILGYTNIGNYARARVFQKQVSTLPLNQITRVLDLGCGYGEYSFMMARALPHVNLTALDIDKDALRNVKYAQNKLRLPNLEIHEGFLNSVQQNEYDLIYSVDVFEHIEKDQMPFGEAFKKLKKGGYLMVKMPHITQTSVFPEAWFKSHINWLKHEHPGQVYTLADLKYRFAQEGFNVIFEAQTDGLLSRLAWEIGFLMKRAGIIFQLLSLPVCKLLVIIDMLLTGNNAKNGNAITVIGQKK